VDWPQLRGNLFPKKHGLLQRIFHQFYAKEKLLTYVSICWGCQNIYSQLKEQNFSAGFNARGAKGKALFQFLQKRLG